MAAPLVAAKPVVSRQAVVATARSYLGTPFRHQGRGDMYVEALVETPVNLSEKQRKLLQEFADAGTDEKTSPESHGFFAKVKELWQDLRE